MKAMALRIVENLITFAIWWAAWRLADAAYDHMSRAAGWQ